MTTRRRNSFWARFNDGLFFHGRDHDTPDVDLSPLEADLLVSHQLSLPKPQYLTPEAFDVCGITGNESLSTRRPKSETTAQRIYTHLVSMGILNEESTTTNTSDTPSPSTPVDTSKITKHFTNTLFFISIRTQKRLVGMLFFWEEECTRFRMLDDEEAEIAKLAETDPPQSEDLKVHLDAVRLKKRLLPSQRAEATANVGAGVGHELPAYGS